MVACRPGKSLDRAAVAKAFEGCSATRWPRSGTTLSVVAGSSSGDPDDSPPACCSGSSYWMLRYRLPTRTSLADETIRDTGRPSTPVFERFERRPGAAARARAEPPLHARDPRPRRSRVRGHELLREALGSRMVLSRRSGTAGADHATSIPATSSRPARSELRRGFRGPRAHRSGCVPISRVDHRHGVHR